MGLKWRSLLLMNISLFIVSIATLQQFQGDHTMSLSSTSDIVLTIQSEDGDVIDCISIHKQPAFNHPALRNHKIQMMPSTDPTMEKTKKEGSNRRSGICPEGTIPIRRMEKKAGPEVRKPFFSHQDKNKLENNEDLELLQFNHSLAVLIAQGFAYYGAKGDIKVCWPQVERDDEYSLSQVALITGPYRNYEAIKSGWAVNPSVYGDGQTRLFVYWTVDGSVNTGCFDLTCPGFVQTSNDIVLGAPIFPQSDPITIFIHKDPETSNWWVNYGEEVDVGYWPAELFSGLRFHAESVQWGGEVYSSRVGIHPHTATDMACGRFANPVPIARSGYVKRMRVVQNEVIVSPEWVNTYADEYFCYSTFYLSDYVEDPEFYYGGPGRNPRCP